MDKQEKQAFEECMKQVKRLLIEEKLTKAKLEKIQKAKLECVRALLDDSFYEDKRGVRMNKKYKPINNLWKDSEGYRYFGTLKLSSKIKYDGDDFIPLWEWVKQLQQENEQLKDNWNMLKEHLKNRYDNGSESISYRQVFTEIREAMQVLEIAQKLEQESDSNE